MRHIEHPTSQEHSGTPTPRKTLTTLERTIALALLGMGLIYLFQSLLVWLVRGAVVLPFLVSALLALLVIGLIVGHRSFAPWLGTLVALAPVVTTLAISLVGSALLHPESNLAFFGILIVQFACALTALVASAAAAIQNARHSESHRPRWLSPFLSGVTGLAVGMLVLAFIVAANPSSTVTPTTTNGMPTVHMAGSNFLTNVVLVPKGDKLLLVDDDSVEHLIQNGTWTSSGMPRPQMEPGAPAVGHLDLKGGSAMVGPFTTAGVFHLYCTIHQGMNLTVLVQ